MEILDDSLYLEPPENEAKKVFECYFCGDDIYEGDEYYCLDGFNCCEDCIDKHFKFTAELPDYEAIKADLDYEDLVLEENK